MPDPLSAPSCHERYPHGHDRPPLEKHEQDDADDGDEVVDVHYASSAVTFRK
jgi:hypothetical protein